MATTAPVCMDSRQASSSNFSMNGSPTCTFGRFCLDSSVNPVAACFCADINDGIADALRLGQENLFFASDAESERIDQRILRIARLEPDFSTDSWHSKAISVVTHAANNAIENAPILGGVFVTCAFARRNFTETQRIEN